MSNTPGPVQHLSRPEGRIAYSVTGTGPLVVATPGMGDLRSTWDDQVPALVAAGYRVAVADLRGHGDSDTTFRTHGDAATASDVVALVEHLVGPHPAADDRAVLLGNSMAGSAAIIAAAERPDLVRGLALVSPFGREHAEGAKRALLHGVLRVLLARPWGAKAWAGYYTSLNKGHRSAWLPRHTAEIRSSMRDTAHLRSFRELALQLDHHEVDDAVRTLAAQPVPTVTLVGALDPDYPDPVAEAAWLRSRLGGTAVVVPDAGHYAQHQAPDVVNDAILALLRELDAPTPAATTESAETEAAEHRA
ncbi:hydrolase [Luteimicrobium album]|uniref:Hydrolase n=1 Tax=Luteimicrobium album TaxID=1054550 RepID=A0ABQ6I485_9MICO|nr:alpha/beta hydrolase [Luteimicrobium album]GMA24963.1 hydrolase [Luteimicrobium album]